MIKKVLFVSTTIISGWLLVEYIVNSDTKKKLRKQIKNFLSDKDNSNFIYYRKDQKILEHELSKVESSEKLHILFSFKNTFKFTNDDIQTVMNKIDSYNSLREALNNDKLINYTEWNMLWYPFFFRILFSLLNIFFFIRYPLYLNSTIYNGVKIYSINKKSNKKYLLIFLGLGGMVFPFQKIIDLFHNKGYNIMIPIYGPSQASLNYNLEMKEIDYYKNIELFLHSKNISSFCIVSWSLGGILYKGFHNYLYKNKSILLIDCVYLFEPLICIRACMDTFFSHRRNFNDTFEIMDSVTSEKYSFYNLIFSYFLHTIVGFSTAHSLGYFTNVETKNKEKINYKRYLFVSSDDLIINPKLDKEYIKNNYSIDKVFYRKGYHGGWPNSNKLIPIMNDIVN
jgi:hypothetical protein